MLFALQMVSGCGGGSSTSETDAGTDAALNDADTSPDSATDGGGGTDGGTDGGDDSGVDMGVDAGDDPGVPPSVSTVTLPAASTMTFIPSTNTVIEDHVLDGGITLGDSIYFFASNGLGPKLYSYSVAGGVVQRSNTNPRGADHAWAGGFRELGGVIYFNAYNAGGCIKLFRYAPGDPMVTTPFVETNASACTSIPTQVAVDRWPLDWADSHGGRGDDTPYATRFDPILLAGRIYFTANDGGAHQVFEYLVGGSSGAVPITEFSEGGGTHALNTFLLGANAGTLYFVGPGGTYQHTPGNALATVETSDVPDVSSAIATGVRVGTSVYYADGGRLFRYTLGDTDSVEVAETRDGADYDPRDLSIIDGDLFFSALDVEDYRNIYLHDLDTGAVTTTPIADPCGSGCTEASLPIGSLGENLYFNARGGDMALGFYRTGSGNAVSAFAVNTVPMDDVTVVATVGGAVYFLAYEGYLGERDGNKHPRYPYMVGNGRVGYGQRHLYVLPAGSTSPVRAFESAPLDDSENPELGQAYPHSFTATSDALYFMAPSLQQNANDEYIQRLYRHAPGQAATTTPVDDGVHVTGQTQSARIAIAGRFYFVADAANDPLAERHRLFSHAAGEGTVVPADALTEIKPSGDDEIARLTDVNGTLVFQATSAEGHDKLYRYRPGDALITAASARSNIVPDAGDGLFWNAVDSVGGDRSVVDGSVLITSGSLGFVYDPASDDVLTASDAVTIAGGEGMRLIRHEGAYWLVPHSTPVIGSTMYYRSGGGGPQYAPAARPITDTGPNVYLPITEPDSGPAEYVRRCTLYGFNDRVIHGVAYMLVYAPGTETCSYVAASPSLTGFPGYVLPFPNLGARQTEYGTDGVAHPLWHDAARGVTYMRGAIAHQRERPRVHKLFAYRNGALTLLSTSMVGNDQAAQPYVANGSTFFSVNACAGMVDFDRGTSGFSCSRLVRYTP